MKKIILTILFVLLSQNIFAYADNENDESRLIVLNVYLPDGKGSYIFTPTAYTSTDNGLNWVSHEIAGAVGIISALSCAGDKHQNCTAVGYLNEHIGKNYIGTLISYNSKNGGITWTPNVFAKHSDGGVHITGANLTDIDCHDKLGQNCVAVGNIAKAGSTPIIYTTIDSGANWLPHYLTEPNYPGKSFGVTLRAISCSGENNQYCTAVGEFIKAHVPRDGKLNSTVFVSYTSSDSGANWASHIIEERPEQGSLLKSISCNGNKGQHCIAVGQGESSIPVNEFTERGIIYTSNDGGITWRPYVPYIDGLTSTLNTITCSGLNDQYCVAIGSMRGRDHNGRDLHIRSRIPSDLKGYEDSYIYIDRSSFLFYVEKNRNLTSVSIRNITKFMKELDDLNKNKTDTLHLSVMQVFNLIIYNSTPSHNLYPSFTTVYTTTNGGVDWKLSTQATLYKALTCSGDNNKYCSAIGIYYLTSAYPGGTAVVYRSNDGGNTWENTARFPTRQGSLEPYKVNENFLNINSTK